MYNNIYIFFLQAYNIRYIDIFIYLFSYIYLVSNL